METYTARQLRQPHNFATISDWILNSYFKEKNNWKIFDNTWYVKWWFSTSIDLFCNSQTTITTIKS